MTEIPLSVKEVVCRDDSGNLLTEEEYDGLGDRYYGSMGFIKIDETINFAGALSGRWYRDCVIA